MDSETTFTELAVALGRVEEGVKALRESVDRIADQGQKNAATITRHEVEIEILKSRQQPRVHWLTIVVGVIAVAGFTLAILDRLYNP